jgi:hypothetical protein
MLRWLLGEAFESEWEAPLAVPPVEIIPRPPDKIAVRTPYNKYFVEEVRMIPTRRWTGEVWEFSDVYREEVERLVRKYFPLQPEEYSLHTIIGKGEVGWRGVEQSPEVDGIGFISFSRDWAKAYNKGYPHIEIHYQNLKSGGSSRHPYWIGKVVFTIAFRKDPILTIPEGCELITHYKGPEPPPLDLIRAAVEEARRDP